MKNKLLIFLLFIIFLISFGCVEVNSTQKTKTAEPVKETTEVVDTKTPTEELPQTVILPDLTNLGRDEIKALLDRLKINYEFKFDYTSVTKAEDRNKFTRYSNPYEAGMEIERTKFIYVYTTVLDITYYVHDELKLNREYFGLSFINDGIGEVTLIRCIDGDTAWFRDLTGEEFKLRFYAVDTPESTKELDPWGKEASNFTSNILCNAETIVLEREENHVTDTYGRYLGYVWVDGVLLNLVLVEECYSFAAAAQSKYKDYFYDVALYAKATGRRIYGEIDPNYNYDN